MQNKQTNRAPKMIGKPIIKKFISVVVPGPSFLLFVNSASSFTDVRASQDRIVCSLLNAGGLGESVALLDVSQVMAHA